MSSVIRIHLSVSPEQGQRLLALQQGFARLCNALSPIVQQTRIWNRVALHHLAYKQLRASFPEMGSQMVCNAIYSVSRTCRVVFQSPQSPLHLDKLAGQPLPLLRFADNCPVYFDRHTLSLKKGQLSMFTLDGRMRFQLALDAEVEARFKQQKLREIVLSRGVDGAFWLAFWLVDLDGSTESAEAAQLTQSTGGANSATGANTAVGAESGIFSSLDNGEIPEYVIVENAV